MNPLSQLWSQTLLADTRWPSLRTFPKKLRFIDSYLSDPNQQLFRRPNKQALIQIFWYIRDLSWWYHSRFPMLGTYKLTVINTEDSHLLKPDQSVYLRDDRLLLVGTIVYMMLDCRSL